MLIAIGLGTLLIGVLVVGAGLYVGTWPLRRLAGHSPNAARLAALQELAVAVAGAVSAFRA